METKMLEDHLSRLEAKVDKLTDAVTRLVLIEERLTNQGKRIGETEHDIAVIDTKLGNLEKKVDGIINKGLGIILAVTTLAAAINFFSKLFNN